MEDYQPQSYWQKRLTDDFSLRGVGHYDYGEEYNAITYQHKARVLAKALAAVPRGSSILDVGSGVGWVVQQLLDHGMQVEGCDIAEVAVEGLQRRFPSARFFQAAVGTDPLPRPDTTYDAATLIDVAFHLTDDALWKAAVTDIVRVLKTQGCLIFTDRLGSTPVDMAAHVRFRSISQWSDIPGTRLEQVRPLYRWLARRKDIRGWTHVPESTRGRIETALELLPAPQPHLRCAVLRKL